MDWKIDKDVDIRDNSNVLVIAEKMELGDSIGGLAKTDAGKLARAIEQTHGARTATIKERDAAFRVWRVAQRPEKARKPRTKKTVDTAAV